MPEMPRQIMRICSATAALVLTLAAATRGSSTAPGLIDAVRTQNHQLIPTLISQADVNQRQPDGATALHWAAHWDDVATADMLLRAGARANVFDDHGVSPLIMAAGNGSRPMVQLLLDHGADANAATAIGDTALMAAARAGSLDAVQALVDRGAVLDATERSRNQTALMWAVAEGHTAVVKYLVGRGASVRAQSSTGFTPLLFAAREGHVASASILLAAGADPNQPARDGTTPLLAAVVRGQTAFAEFLLSKGADPNGDAAGYTALHWATGTWETSLTGALGFESAEWQKMAGLRGGEKLAFVRALLAAGANPNVRTKKSPPVFGFTRNRGNLIGATPFLLASMAGDADTMRLLVAAGSDPLVTLADNTTPLMVAAGVGGAFSESRVTETNALEAARLALALRIDVNAANDSGDTALHRATIAGADRIVEFLVASGAAVNVKNKRGETPLMFAEGYGSRTGATNILNKSTAELLKRLGAHH